MWLFPKQQENTKREQDGEDIDTFQTDKVDGNKKVRES